MAFPNTPLPIRTELQLSGVWTDISDDVYNRQDVVIVRGRRDEGARVDPGKCTLTLNNRDGVYSPRNPMSPLYGLLGRNTPMRVSVLAGDPFLALDGDPANHASTPDAAALDITGDIDIRCEASLDWHDEDLNQVLIAKWDGTANQRSYSLRVFNHLLVLNWSTNGTTQSFAQYTLPDLPERAAVRATLDVDDGAGGLEATFYWADSLDGPWTEFGSVSAASTTSIHAGTADLRVGGQDPTTTPPRTPFTGRGHRFEVRDGINGTIVANPDFTAQAVGASSFADSAGRTWTVQGDAEITNRRERFTGEISAWPPEWEASGADVWVSVQAAGIKRRLGQGSKPLDSTLRRRIPSGNPVAYWPMEEEQEATRAYSPTPGVDPMLTSGLEFAADDSLAGSAALPSIGATASIAGTVPSSTPGAWQVEFVYFLETLPGSLTTMMEITTTGTVRTHRLSVQTNNVRLQGLDSGGTQVYLINVLAPSFTGTWNRLQVRAEENGSDVDLTLWWGVIGGSGFIPVETYAGTAGRVESVGSTFGAGLEGLRIGHLAVFAEVVGDEVYDNADTGFNEETAGTRLLRLATEEDVPLVLAGHPDNTEPMGPQRSATLLSLLDECADADGGVLLERRDRTALRYRPRVTAYNRPITLALDYTAPGEIPQGALRPVEDDQALRNDITVKRVGGSSARAVDETSALSVQAPPDGVGRYDEEVTLNLATDDQTDGHAGWRLHLGTWDEARYPTLLVDLAAAPHLIEEATDVDVWDRLQVANPPPWLPPEDIDLAAQGYTETLGLYRWRIEYNCAPAGPWTVAVTDDELLGLVDADGSELAAGIDTDDTTLSVTVTTGPLWTTDSGEMPVDIVIGGERMTVTAITGATSPQSFTVTRSVNGIVKSHSAGAAVRLAQRPVVAL